ncbi:FbpB family small basic protein [Sporolactobacillus terrae]|uniref:FbpB family small basic protein n=1 Tax=Sporolactobacillus terrae TaxID=269673 RepID=A0ABX5Q550_9BACL|nr:FbpB family small basic protein [Sporolactobacillus terrae]QAA21757.1 FbpB family small basic protein [Sporolactobacillus terrae]QAA24731.1 FbpB family small basic protein [Sporolactobacillus terrae]UAK16560.1 FbpB family small basic protein [Sporolactobacillus terrae]
MKRKVTYMQLVKKNKEEILSDRHELNRIERKLDERRAATVPVRNKSVR